MTEVEKQKLYLEDLEGLSAKPLKAQQQIELYQARISASYNKKVKVWSFKKGNFILDVRWPIIMMHKKKS